MRISRVLLGAVILTLLATSGVAQAGMPPYNWTGQEQIAGTTSHPPGTGSACTEDILAWKGQESDRRIYYTSQAAGPGQHEMPGWAQTDDKPDVDCDRWAGNRLGIVWRDAANGGIYISYRTAPGPWSEPRYLGGPAAGGPSLAWAGDYHYVVWRGYDYRIRYTYSHNSEPFTAPAVIEGDVFTDTDPNVGYVIGRFRVTWKIYGHIHMYHSDVPYEGTTWSAPTLIGGGGGSNYAPSISGRFVVWRGVSPDTRLYYTYEIAEGQWAPQGVVCGAGGSSGTPDVQEVFKQMPPGSGPIYPTYHVVWKGIGGDQRIFQTFGSQASYGAVCRY